MIKHIGIVGCSAEGAALCYRTVCQEAAAVLGEHNHPEITLHTIPLGDYMQAIERDDWRGVGERMLVSAGKLAQAGADFLICPDNTIHQAFDFIRDRLPRPWLHIAEVVAEEAARQGHKRVGVLGTKYLTEGPVYPQALKKFSVAGEIPAAADRERINTIIFKELVNGVLTEESRFYFNQVMEKLKQRGCEAAALACTEIPLLVRPGEAPLPTLDSTRLLARAALRRAQCGD